MRPAKPFSYKTREWQAMRSRILARDGYRCVLCNAPVSGKGAARVDHITEVRKDAAVAMDPMNLRTLCVDCDAKRHAEKGQRKVVRVAIGLDGFPE
jgi:5-methylcytosine-specific restriction enzyme A